MGERLATTLRSLSFLNCSISSFYQFLKKTGVKGELSCLKKQELCSCEVVLEEERSCERVFAVEKVYFCIFINVVVPTHNYLKLTIITTEIEKSTQILQWKIFQADSLQDCQELILCKKSERRRKKKQCLEFLPTAPPRNLPGFMGSLRDYLTKWNVKICRDWKKIIPTIVTSFMETIKNKYTLLLKTSYCDIAQINV